MNFAKILPRELTSYDVLKFFAVVIMIIDHVGYYFYPEVAAFRAIGRIGFPVWFFLVGYASGRAIDWRLMVGAVILIATSAMVGVYIFPLSALVTIMAIRLVLDRVMGVMLRNGLTFAGVAALLFLLIEPTGHLVEYGTQGLILAAFGYIVRHKPVVPGLGGAQETGLYAMLFAAGSFMFIQQNVFHFPLPMLLLCLSGTLLVCVALYLFRPVVVPGTAGWWSWPVRMAGRHTLFIYVAHLVAFRVAALLWVGGAYQFMEIRWFAP